MKSFILATLLLATSSPRPAMAQNPEYLAGVIGNHTSMTIHYHVKWGNGPWKPYTLQPGEKHQHYVTGPFQGGYPTLHLCYDNFAGDNQLTLTNTTVAKHLCRAPGAGWYQFFNHNFADNSGGRKIWVSR